MTERPQRRDSSGDKPVSMARRRVDDPVVERELERLESALELAEKRRKVAEQTLASIATSTAGRMRGLEERVAALEAHLVAERESRRKAEEERDQLRSARAADVLLVDEEPFPGRRPKAKRRLWSGVLALALAAGLALMVDGFLTIFWQEPVTALVASSAQRGLADDLEGLEQRFAQAAVKQRRAAAAVRVRSLAGALARERKPGQALGRLRIPKLGISAVMVEGTGKGSLFKGPGHYASTVLPGQSGTVGIAGHRTTYGAPFRNIDRLRRGSRIVVSMPYGRFVYRVVQRRIVAPKDVWVLLPRSGDRLVLTACHPLYSAAKRIVVSAELDRSPVQRV